MATFEKAENIEYNADGHIVTYGDGDNTYVYDGLGRLIRENNKVLDKTFVFEYNVGGNIISKNEYVYTEGMIEGEPTKTYAYTYTNIATLIFLGEGKPSPFLSKMGASLQLQPSVFQK